MPRCCCQTRDGSHCSKPVATYHKERWFCDIHDPLKPGQSTKTILYRDSESHNCGVCGHRATQRWGESWLCQRHLSQFIARGKSKPRVHIEIDTTVAAIMREKRVSQQIAEKIAWDRYLGRCGNAAGKWRTTPAGRKSRRSEPHGSAGPAEHEAPL